MDSFYKWLMVDGKGEVPSRLFKVDIFIVLLLEVLGAGVGLVAPSWSWADGVVLGFILGMFIAIVFNLFIADYSWTYYALDKKRRD